MFKGKTLGFPTERRPASFRKQLSTVDQKTINEWMSSMEPMLGNLVVTEAQRNKDQGTRAASKQTFCAPGNRVRASLKDGSKLIAATPLSSPEDATTFRSRQLPAAEAPDSDSQAEEVQPEPAEPPAAEQVEILDAADAGDAETIHSYHTLDAHLVPLAPARMEELVRRSLHVVITRFDPLTLAAQLNLDLATNTTANSTVISLGLLSGFYEIRKAGLLIHQCSSDAFRLSMFNNIKAFH
ncbi:hypothetical protein W97_05535 [Coniosporium apollinis CBS 100218]|uniref:Uncharacterized protein n=1 Tax=Coniosporium apollinis (strain CBS 100218) TaxID=1168221 RepID=R7YX05_CONA1|nr:uncharacterized protein W97_05535 [Coniosporium apollinis CBS 100218]EON66437.1 hypothetical protein W97_05535 [Coniosporium apollinis CBS 100218]